MIDPPLAQRSPRIKQSARIRRATSSNRWLGSVTQLQGNRSARRGPRSEDGGGALPCPSIPQRRGPRGGRSSIRPDPADGLNDVLRFNKPVRAVGDRYRTFCIGAHGQTGNAQNRCFFLHAARIGDHNSRIGHECCEIEIAQRLDHPYARRVEESDLLEVGSTLQCCRCTSCKFRNSSFCGGYQQ